MSGISAVLFVLISIPAVILIAVKGPISRPVVIHNTLCKCDSLMEEFSLHCGQEIINSNPDNFVHNSKHCDKDAKYKCMPNEGPTQIDTCARFKNPCRRSEVIPYNPTCDAKLVCEMN